MDLAIFLRIATSDVVGNAASEGRSCVVSFRPEGASWWDGGASSRVNHNQSLSNSGR